jgi:hypothetical protein
MWRNGKEQIDHDINSMKFNLVVRRINSAGPITKPTRLYAYVCVYTRSDNKVRELYCQKTYIRAGLVTGPAVLTIHVNQLNWIELLSRSVSFLFPVFKNFLFNPTNTSFYTHFSTEY